jgi:hypothetical protein
MSVLDVLDATNLCTRWSGPEAWALGPPEPPRRSLAAADADFSWWSLVRNPQALLLTGVIAAGLVRDNVLRPLAG